MRKFDNIHDAYEWFSDFKPYNWPVEGMIVPDDLNIGDWILVRRLVLRDDGYFVSRPFYGVFVGYSAIDQAVGLNFVEKNRAWMYHCEVGCVGASIDSPVSFWQPRITEWECWHNTFEVIASWKQKPSIRQLRDAMALVGV